MKPAAQTLNVYWNQDRVGELWNDEQNLLHFTYAASWLDQDKAPITLSMPLRKGVYQKEARTFFGNLLPEGDFRRRIGQLVRVSADNDLSLLKEIGGDCAGALKTQVDLNSKVSQRTMCSMWSRISRKFSEVFDEGFSSILFKYLAYPGSQTCRQIHLKRR